MSMMGYEEKDVQHMIAAIRHAQLLNVVKEHKYVRDGLALSQDFLEGLLEEGRM